MPTALITGASQGLGLALAGGLAADGWSLIIDARTGADLARAETEIRARLHAGATVLAVAGDVVDPTHRDALIAAAAETGRLDLVVNNASTLGPSPLPALAAYPLDALRTVLETNVVAPLALIQLGRDQLLRSPDPRILNVTSDASVEAYPGWGGYGSAKAALDHLSAVLAAEEAGIRVWAVDPGDLRTAMHQAAFPGEDISDRPAPDTVVPALIGLIGSDRPSGRLRLAELGASAGSRP